LSRRKRRAPVGRIGWKASLPTGARFLGYFPLVAGAPDRAGPRDDHLDLGGGRRPSGPPPRRRRDGGRPASDISPDGERGVNVAEGARRQDAASLAQSAPQRRPPHQSRPPSGRKSQPLPDSL